MTKAVPLPPLEYLKECFRYNKLTGVLTWKARHREHFVSSRGWNRWNARYAGKEAFTTVTQKGHKHGSIDKRLYLAHRVIWKLVTGKDPIELIDHEDNDGANNCWKNLREANNGQNRINSRQRKNNPRHGVYYKKGRWVAHIGNGTGGQKHLGGFGSEAKAIAARRLAERAAYGEFAK